MTLESGIYRKHRTPFILDADTLRRMEGTLKKSAQDYGEALELVFRVEREDHRFYETLSVEDVIADPNASTRRINLLSINLRSARPAQPHLGRDDIVSLTFDNQRDGPSTFGPNVALKIASPNRTWALLMADDLEPQIQRTLKARRTPRSLILLVVIPAAVGAYKFMSYNFPLAPEFFVVFLTAVLGCVIVGWGISLSGLMGDSKWFTKYFGPESVFVWGSELQDYAERERFRYNIQWAVIVGFFVSLAAGIASLWF